MATYWAQVCAAVRVTLAKAAVGDERQQRESVLEDCCGHDVGGGTAMALWQVWQSCCQVIEGGTIQLDDCGLICNTQLWERRRG